MELRKARLQMIKAFQGGWDAMAGALGMSRDALENRIYERKGQSVLTELDLQMQAFSGTTAFAEAIASLSGGTFIKLPSIGEVDNESLLAKFNELHAELGMWSRKFADYTADGEVDPREQTDLSDVADKIHQTMDEMRALTFRIYCRDAGSVTKQSLPK